MKNKTFVIGSVKVAVKKSLSLLLNRLQKKNVKITKINKDKDGYNFVIRRQDLTILTDICNETKIDFSIIERTDILAKIKEKGYDLFLIAGIILSISALIVLSNLSIDYKVNDNDALNYYQIKNIGTGCEIKLFSVVDDEKIKNLQTKILSSDGVADCTVLKKGNKIFVTISQSLSQEYFEISEERGNAYALFDGTIVQVISKSGTPKIKVGDEVKKGDLLLEAQYTVGDEIYPTTVDGEVYAEIIYSENYVLPKTIYITKKGNFFRCGNEFFIFGKKLFSTVKEKGFTEKRIIEYKPLGILPISVTNYYAAQSSESIVNPDKKWIEQNVIKVVSEAFSDKYKGVLRDVKTEYLTKSVDNYIIIDVYYTGIARIDLGG